MNKKLVPKSGYKELQSERSPNLYAFLKDIKQSWLNNTYLHDELALRSAEVTRLQQAVSDLQVMIIKEREESLNKSRQLDRKDINELRLNKTIDILLDKLGISRNDLPKIYTDREKLKLDLKASTTNASHSVPKDLETLLIENDMLKDQIDQLQKTHKAEVEILLKDRELVAEERIIETSRLRKDISQIKKRLIQVQSELFESTEKLINYQEMVDNLGEKTSAISAPVYSKRSTTCLQEQLAESTRMASVYKELAEDLERELNIWKDKAETNEKTFKIRTEKMSSDINLMKNRYEELDRRRLLEAAGFRQDIKMLREKLKDVEKKLAKMKSDKEAVTALTAVEEDLRLSTKHTLQRARMLESELLNLKRKVAAMEL